MTAFCIEGATVFLPDDAVKTTVRVEDGLISGVGEPAGDLPVVNGRGLILAPALIDLHGDAFERQLMPRPNVYFPLETALIDTDRQLATNGIATAYHSVTLSWEPGLRSVERARDMMQALVDLAPRLTAENRVQLRWETFAFEAFELIDWALAGPLAPSIAFNDHTSMGMRSFDTAIQDRVFEQRDDYAVADPDDPRFGARHIPHAKRAGLDPDAYLALLKTVWDRRPDVGDAIMRVAAAGRAAGVPMLSHDDTTAETRAYYRSIGATVAEFPMVMEAAEAARSNGDAIVFGAPNAVRGGSHIGSLAAADMVEAGLCDALASDYFYPAMLAAVARLDREKRAARPALWQLVSSGPARALKLHDRGTIAPGRRADLVLVDWPDGHAPAIRTTWVNGRIAYSGQPMG